MRTSLQLQLINLGAGLALVVVLLALLASSAQAAPAFTRGTGASYYGLTSQDSPILIELSKDGRVVKRAVGAFDLNCTSGDGPFVMTLKDSWTDVIVELNRSFKRSFSDSDTLPSGSTIEDSGEFTGRFDRKRKTVKGTWRIQFVDHELDGSTTTCESGLLHFSARRMQG